MPWKLPIPSDSPPDSRSTCFVLPCLMTEGTGWASVYSVADCDALGIAEPAEIWLLPVLNCLTGFTRFLESVFAGCSLSLRMIGFGTD